MTSASHVSDPVTYLARASGVPVMAPHQIAMVVAGAALVVVGAYIMARPRRLFMREEERAEYRPASVPIDSAQGRWLIRAAPAYVVAGLVLIAGALL